MISVKSGRTGRGESFEQLQRSSGKIGMADLVLLDLQLCLVSDSRHMSRCDWQVGRYLLQDPWLAARAVTAGFMTVEREESLKGEENHENHWDE